MGMFNKNIGIMGKFLTYIPLTYNGILKNMVGDDFTTILDVGCGTGIPMEIINMDRNKTATGVDIYKPYLLECKKKKLYKKLIQADVRKLPFKEKSYEVVMCFHVIEHLSKKEGIKLIKSLEKIAKKRVVLAMPLGHLHQEEYDGNKYQVHKSEWYPKDFKKLGYKVVGQGLNAIYKEENVVEKYGFFANFIFAFSMVFQPLLFIKPEWARYIICSKEII